jgi:ribosome-associated toxin RatA of RatAB toxin-antitoxin module
LTSEATWTLTEVDSRLTKVTQVLDFRMMPRFGTLGRLLETLFTRTAQKETDRMLHDFKQLSEAGNRGSSL